jgi:hypothetical protein
MVEQTSAAARNLTSEVSALADQLRSSARAGKASCAPGQVGGGNSGEWASF